MKWFPFAVLATIGIICQTTVVRYLRVDHWIGPDWMFILALHYALWGPWPDAAIGAWILGLLTDLSTAATGSRIGLHAFCYGAAAWGIIRVRQVVVRSHPVAQFLIALAFALGIQVVVAIYRRWASAGHDFSGVGWGAFLSALYTALCAPPLLWLLGRLGPLTGIRAEPRSKRRRSAR